MKVQDILGAKGSRVATTRSDATIAGVIRRLKVENIGALVVSDDEHTLLGLISERDIIRGLADRGPLLLELPVDQVMAREVPTCRPEEPLGAVMAKMTRSRSRHVPVVVEGRIAGLVSIGDVVKHRLGELEQEAQWLRDAHLWPRATEEGVAAP
jgi:CBS domain-containing protein